MDHVKKLVYTIVGCLTIVSLTFTICTKIGHCADETFYIIDSYPLPFGFESRIGYGDFEFNNDVISTIKSTLDGINFTHYHMVGFMNEVGQDYIQVTIFPVSNNNSFNFVSTGYNHDISFVAPEQNFPIYQYRFYSDGSKLRIGSPNAGSISRTISIASNFDGNLFLCDTFLTWYPVFNYDKDSGLFETSIGSYFVYDYPHLPEEEPSGHTKGGVLSNYIDSQDLIEDSSEVNKVDNTPPSDSSSIPGWLQKILNGLGTINGSIQSGVLTIGDYLGQLKEDIENAIAWITEPPDSDEILENVEPYLAENDLISGFLSSKTTIQGVYTSIGNVSAKTCSQMVWDIPFNLPSMSQTFHAVIDFGWYENIRSTFEPFLNMFLCIGFLFSFIRSIPGILHGNSGEGDT